MAMDRASGRPWAARLFGSSPARTLALLQAAWPLAVGPELARRTEVVGIENRTLRVRVPDVSWRKVLHRVSAQILARLREIAGDDLTPRRMGFLEGGMTSIDTPLPPPLPPPPPRPPALPAVIARVSQSIPDAEIRARFQSAAARYLARTKGPTHA
jgi:Dna[CI] antecedent, DciA